MAFCFCISDKEARWKQIFSLLITIRLLWCNTTRLVFWKFRYWSFQTYLQHWLISYALLVWKWNTCRASSIGATDKQGKPTTSHTVVHQIKLISLATLADETLRFIVSSKLFALHTLDQPILTTTHVWMLVGQAHSHAYSWICSGCNIYRKYSSSDSV